MNSELKSSNRSQINESHNTIGMSKFSKVILQKKDIANRTNNNNVDLYMSKNQSSHNSSRG